MVQRRMVDLDAVTRKWMLEELRRDVEGGTLYYSQALSERGRRELADILKEAFEHHDEVWLANALGSGDRMNLGSTSAHQTDTERDLVTVFEPENLAWGEFLRYYARGLCRRALDEGVEELEIYKYTDAANPRLMDQILEVDNRPAGVEEGRRVAPGELLEELRKNPESELFAGVPGEADSGLGVRLPESVRKSDRSRVRQEERNAEKRRARERPEPQP